MAFRVTIEDFIKRARKKHGDKYNYDYVDLSNGMHSKIKIVCPIHGEFMQSASQHLQGDGCKLCAYAKNAKHNSKSHEQFLTECIQKWGDTYDLSKTIYRGAKEKIIVICKKHGDFLIKPSDFLNGHGCAKCGGTKKLTLKEFISKAKAIHGGTYDYSKVEYVNNRTKICIICPEHGEFFQTPLRHLCGDRCPKCFKSYKKTNEEFINDAVKIHGKKYNYSKVKYLSNKKDIIIICPKHGEFIQKPLYHLQGKGCPKCNESHLEKDVRVFLEENNIKYVYQANKRVLEILGKQTLDFYLPDYGIAIECQGEQHFNPHSFIKERDSEILNENFKKTINRDIIKYNNCLKIGVKLLYYIKDLNEVKKSKSWYFYKDKILINDFAEIKNHLIN